MMINDFDKIKTVYFMDYKNSGNANTKKRRNKMSNKIIEFNVSTGKGNYSQRNNKVLPGVSCGPTNMIQALDYAGWKIPDDRYPDLPQLEDKLTRFSREDPEVLAYYEKKYKAMYDAWKKEVNEKRQSGQPEYLVNCIDSYAPNEVHDVLNYATNLFLGYTPEDISKGYRATNFYENVTMGRVIDEIIHLRPVVMSVKHGSYGHYVTVVGFTTSEKNVLKDFCGTNYLKNEDDIIDYIIDNTYGRFNFETGKYDNVSGDDEHISKEKFESMLKPIGSETKVAHFFKSGAATI